MHYKKIVKGSFLERQNRFTATCLIEGRETRVHVKNTGRLGELLLKGSEVCLLPADKEERKTSFDLISVKSGDEIVHIDSQAPNVLVAEWLEKQQVSFKREVAYGASRLDFQTEEGYIEVKGVTLKQGQYAVFPDAPSTRAIKHVRELIKAKEAGHEAALFFVVQRSDCDFVTPNTVTSPEFAEAVKEAKQKGVLLKGFKCRVTEKAVRITGEIPVVLPEEALLDAAEGLMGWYEKNKRDLPWRKDRTPYKVLVSEVMLQQTTVKAVIPYFERFMQACPDVLSLSKIPDLELNKLWEGLGYYSRARNLKKAAEKVVSDCGGLFPDTYEGVKSLPGVGDYTAGAIMAFAYQKPYPALDGNAVRVITRLMGFEENVSDPKVLGYLRGVTGLVIPKMRALEYNEALIEFGALVCGKNPDCPDCPVKNVCRGYRYGIQKDLPKKNKAPQKKVQKKTVLIFVNDDKIGIEKRPSEGLLAGLYGFPLLQGRLSPEEVRKYLNENHIRASVIKPFGETTHIFTHLKWEMTGYLVYVSENTPLDTFVTLEALKEKYALPSAFKYYLTKMYGLTGKDQAR